MESRRNGPQLSSRHDDDDDVSLCAQMALLPKLDDEWMNETADKNC